MSKEEKSKKPVYAKTVGNVRAAVFANDNNGRTYFNVVVSRTFKDGDEWKSSSSLNGLGDVVSALHALKLVAHEISQRKEENQNGGEA